MKNTFLKFAGLIFMLLLFNYGYAQKKTFIRDYIYQASENDSKNTARAAATQQMQTLLLQEIGQAIQSEQTLRKLSVAKDGKETFSEDFSQEVMAITAGFVEMKILHETWNGKIYYIEAQMTVDPKEVSERVTEMLNSKQKDNTLKGAKKEEVKAEPAKTEVEKRVQELEAQKKEIALKLELKKQQEIEAKKLAKLEKELAKEKEKEMEEAKYAKGWYQPNAFGIGGGLGGLSIWEANVGYTKNISPNLGFDIVILSFGWEVYSQLLTGLRFSTNRFGGSKNTYFYTSLRAGVGSFDYSYYDYGNNYDDHYTYDGFSFAAELEAGFHFKYFFLGTAVHLGFFKAKANDYYGYSTQSKEQGAFDRIPAISLRLGFDFGKRVAY